MFVARRREVGKAESADNGSNGKTHDDDHDRRKGQQRPNSARRAQPDRESGCDFPVRRGSGHSPLSVAQAPEMTTSSLSFTFTCRATPPPTFQPSVTSVSPGQTGRRNWASKALNREESPSQAHLTTWRTMNPNVHRP